MFVAERDSARWSECLMLGMVVAEREHDGVSAWHGFGI